MKYDIISTKIYFVAPHGEQDGVPARFNMDSEEGASLIEVNLDGLILPRDKLVEWLCEAEVQAIEEHEMTRAVERGDIDPPHDWRADEARAYRAAVL